MHMIETRLESVVSIKHRGRVISKKSQCQKEFLKVNVCLLCCEGSMSPIGMSNERMATVKLCVFGVLNSSGNLPIYRCIRPPFAFVCVYISFSFPLLPHAFLITSLYLSIYLFTCPSVCLSASLYVFIPFTFSQYRGVSSSCSTFSCLRMYPQVCDAPLSPPRGFDYVIDFCIFVVRSCGATYE